MTHSITPRTDADLRLARLLADLLERLDRFPDRAVSAWQYQAVARHLAGELARLPAGEALSAVLDAYPAAAELYENINYQHAGLCRAPLEWGLDAELRAREAIVRAMEKRTAHGQS